MRALLKKSAHCLLCAALVMALCPAMAFAKSEPAAQGANPIMRLFKTPGSHQRKWQFRRYGRDSRAYSRLQHL